LNSLSKRITVLALILLSLSGCSKDKKPTAPIQNSGTLMFLGTVNGESGTLSGSVSFSVNNTAVTGVFKVKTPAIATHSLTGVYNTTTKVLAATGDNFAFSGMYDGASRLEGAVTGPVAGTFVAVKDDDSSAVAFCGTFSGDDDGIWNFTIHGTTVTGSFTTTSGNTGALNGTISGNSITIANTTGSNPLATGTRSGDNASGTWNDGRGNSGNWIGYQSN
jgi:hypothetical protein